MYSFLPGIFLSVLYRYFVLAYKTGDEPKVNPTIYPILYRGMIIVPISSNTAIHIHHWILYLSILCMSRFMYIHPICIGFSAGLTFQGLTYSDRFVIRCKNPYHNVNRI